MGIACSWSCCIDGFHLLSRLSQSSGRRLLCAGTGPASGDIGDGNPAPLEADRKSRRSRSGNVWDNAAMESFFSSLKTERIGRKEISAEHCLCPILVLWRQTRPSQSAENRN